jgi:hypothetical protein
VACSAHPALHGAQTPMWTAAPAARVFLPCSTSFSCVEPSSDFRRRTPTTVRFSSTDSTETNGGPASGQSRPYVRPICAAYSAGHHGCTLACQAPTPQGVLQKHGCLSGIAWTVLTNSLPITPQMASCRMTSGGASPVPTDRSRGVMSLLTQRIRHVRLSGRPPCASSRPKRRAHFCLPVRPKPSAVAGAGALPGATPRHRCSTARPA